MQFPYVISLDLLNNERFQYFTAFSSTNQLEEIFIQQTALLHRFFGVVFEKNKKGEDINLIKEIKEYKRRLFLDIDKKLANFQEKLEEMEEMKKKLSEIFKNF